MARIWIYRCGHPNCIDADPPLTLTVGGAVNGRHRKRRYRCLEQHLSRGAEVLDKFVEGVIVKRLAHFDAADLLTPTEHAADAAKLGRHAAALRTKLREALQPWRDDVLTAAEYRTTRADLERRLAAIEERQRSAAGRDPLAGIAGRADAAEVWERLGLGRQRAILEALVVVTVLPQRPGRMPDGSRFDTSAVRIEPAGRQRRPAGNVAERSRWRMSRCTRRCPDRLDAGQRQPSSLAGWCGARR